MRVLIWQAKNDVYYAFFSESSIVFNFTWYVSTFCIYWN